MSKNRKPFEEYTPEEWDAYNKWAAEHLRRDADKNVGGQPEEVLRKWRDTADDMESQVGKRR